MRVIAGGGARVTGRSTTRHVRRKGYSANRVAYDQRRRLSQRSETTRSYFAVLQQDPCSFCGEAAEDNRNGVSDVDHIVPLKRGGLDQWENMTAACARCNRGRRETDLLTYLLKRSARAACT